MPYMMILGHKGRDRTTSIMKQRFFWPGMDAFIKDKIKTCDRCILQKSRGGNSAELVNITSSSPMEIVCIDYLSPERFKVALSMCWWWLITFQGMCRRFPPRSRQPRPRQGCYSTTSLSTMVFRTGSIAIWESVLIRNSSSSCDGLLEWRSLERHPTTPWETAKWSVLTRLCFRCLRHWIITRKVIGKHTSRHLFTPTMRQSTTALDIRHFSSFLDAIQD